MPACHAGDRRFESGRVRHQRFPQRPVRPPGRGVLLRPTGTIAAVTRRPVIVVLVLILLAIAIPVAGGELGFGAASSPSPSSGPLAGEASASPTLPGSGGPTPVASPAASGDTSAGSPSPAA